MFFHYRFNSISLYFTLHIIPLIPFFEFCSFGFHFFPLLIPRSKCTVSSNLLYSTLLYSTLLYSTLLYSTLLYTLHTDSPYIAISSLNRIIFIFIVRFVSYWLSNCVWQVTLVLSIVSSIYLLTYSMVQSPSWEANWFAASQEILRISRNPKVHYRTLKRPPPVSILGQPNPVHIPTSYLVEIHPNIIHPSTPRPPQWFLSLRLPHQDPIHPLSSPIRATCPAHLILLDFIPRTILGEEYNSYSSSLCNLLHSPVTSSLLGPNILLNTMFSNTLSLLSSRNISDQVSQPLLRTEITLHCSLLF